MLDEHVELLERAFVHQEFETLAGGELAARMLGLDTPFTAAGARAGTPPFEVFANVFHVRAQFDKADHLPLLERVPGFQRPGHRKAVADRPAPFDRRSRAVTPDAQSSRPGHRSEEHTSELQSRPQLVCRPLLEKQKHNRLLQIRQRAEMALGKRFDRMRFNDFVLAQGMLPPRLLEKAVTEEFIPSQ